MFRGLLWNPGETRDTGSNHPFSKGEAQQSRLNHRVNIALARAKVQLSLSVLARSPTELWFAESCFMLRFIRPSASLSCWLPAVALGGQGRAHSLPASRVAFRASVESGVYAAHHHPTCGCDSRLFSFCRTTPSVLLGRGDVVDHRTGVCAVCFGASAVFQQEAAPELYSKKHKFLMLPSSCFQPSRWCSRANLASRLSCSTCGLKHKRPVSCLMPSFETNPTYKDSPLRLRTRTGRVDALRSQRTKHEIDFTNLLLCCGGQQIRPTCRLLRRTHA